MCVHVHRHLDSVPSAFNDEEIMVFVLKDCVSQVHYVVVISTFKYMQQIIATTFLVVVVMKQ